MHLRSWLIGLCLLSFCLACGNGSISSTDHTGADAGDDGCTPGRTMVCTCDNGGQGVRQCDDEGTSWSVCFNCVLDDGGIPDAGADEQSADEAPQSDQPIADQDQPTADENNDPTLPLACSDNPKVELPKTEFKPRHCHLSMIERHFADGSDVRSEITVTLLDSSQFTGVKQPGVDLGGGCTGYLGPRMSASEKHCEYTTTACQNESECAEGVACRDTDRLVTDSVNVTGIKSGDTSLLQIDTGTWNLTDLPVIFHTGDDRINVRVEKSEADHNFTNWGFSYIYMPSPRLMEVTSPDLSGSAVLEAGDLHLEWNNKNRLESFQSTTIFIDISGQQTSKAKASQTRTVSLACVAFHDKCHTIPAAAVDWLLQSDEQWQAPEKVDFVVSHRYQLDGYEYEDQEHTDYTSVESIEYHGSMLVK